MSADTASSPEDIGQLHLLLDQTRAELQACRTELAACQRQLQDMSEVLLEQNAVDALTGLGNRRAFNRVMGQQTARTARSQSPLALAFVDIDHFKIFNLELGRAAGDAALQKIAQALQSHARAYDYVLRFDDRKLAIVLPDTPGEAAQRVAERVRDAVEKLPWNHRPLTISIGVATTSTTAGNKTINERADNALLQAKRRGRNCVVVIEDRG